MCERARQRRESEHLPSDRLPLGESSAGCEPRNIRGEHAAASVGRDAHDLPSPWRWRMMHGSGLLFRAQISGVCFSRGGQGGGDDPERSRGAGHPRGGKREGGGRGNYKTISRMEHEARARPAASPNGGARTADGKDAKQTKDATAAVELLKRRSNN